MDAIFSDLSAKKVHAPKSMAAMSTGSMFSQMRPGAFFKMVESPFKMQMMNAYEKMQSKGAAMKSQKSFHLPFANSSMHQFVHQ